MTETIPGVRILLIGAGNLGRRFARLITEKRDDIQRRYGLDLRIVGVADSRGAAIDPTGLDGEAIAEVKEHGGTVSELAGVGRPGMSGMEMIRSQHAEVLCEAGPVNLNLNAEPGLSHVREALRRGIHVAAPNKGPVVLAYRELAALAKENDVQLRFDGTVAGGLPALYIGMRDLRGATISRIETIPNLTTGFVLDRLAGGATWEDAIAEARAEGVLEGDGAWDLDGWDAAAKLAILAQAVLGIDVSIGAVPRTGIGDLDLEWLRTKGAAGHLVRLVASARRTDDGHYDLLVSPSTIPEGHPLAHLGSKSMGVVFETDIYGTIAAMIDEPTPLPSAATMLRDVLDVYL